MHTHPKQWGPTNSQPPQPWETPGRGSLMCHPSLRAPGTQADVGLDLRPEDSGGLREERRCRLSEGERGQRCRNSGVPRSPAPATNPGRAWTGVTGSGSPFLSSRGSQEGENLNVMQANSDQRREDFRDLPGLTEKMLRTVGGKSTPCQRGRRGVPLHCRS